MIFKKSSNASVFMINIHYMIFSGNRTGVSNQSETGA